MIYTGYLKIVPEIIREFKVAVDTQQLKKPLWCGNVLPLHE